MATKKAEPQITETRRVEKSLQQIANSLGYLVVHTDELKGQSNNELIPLLASLGFDRGSISTILRTTPETVSVRLSQLKAKSKSGKAG